MTTVRSGRCVASYYTYSDGYKPERAIAISTYAQEDGYSCGFIAALTVARYFNAFIHAQDVLAAVRPSINYGVGRKKLVEGLEQLGIAADYRTDLTITDLREYVEYGTPVIVSVWPEEWYSDHWTVVQGFDEDWIYLTNYDCLSIEEFHEEWSDFDMRGQGYSGEGIVCYPGG